MTRRGFLGSLLGLAAAKIAGVSAPETAPLLPSPYVTSGYAQVVGVPLDNGTMATTAGSGLATVYLVEGKYILNGQEVPWTYTDTAGRIALGKADVRAGRMHSLEDTFKRLRG